MGKIYKIIWLRKFWESAPYKEIYSHLELTSDKIVEIAKKIIKTLNFENGMSGIKNFPKDLDIENKKILLRVDFNVH